MDSKIRDKIAIIFPKVVSFFVMFAVAYIAIVSKNEPTMLRSNSKVTSNTTLAIDGVGEVEAPYFIEAKKGRKYTVRDTIPETVRDGDFMMIYSNFSRQRVSVNGSLLGAYGERKRMTKTNLIGNVRVLVPVSASVAGKEVMIEFTPYYDEDFDYIAPVYGSRDALIFSVLMDNIGRIIIVIMMFTLFIIAGCLAVYIKVSKSTLNVKAMTYYALFLLFVMMWIICSSDIPQFFTNANVLISFISFISLSLMGIAFNGFCEQTFEEYDKIYDVLLLVGWLLPLVNAGGFLLGISDPMTMLPITHLYYVISAIISLFVTFSNWKKRPENRIFTISVAIMVVTTGGGMVLYYTVPTTGRPGFFVGIGLMVFSLGLLATIIRRIVTMVEVDTNVATFRELAYEDVMTGLGNRSKFEKFFDDADDMEIEGRTVTLFMFDLNFLKKVNDEFGHKAGDQMIIGLAKCIEKNFSKIGTSYRLGGDEFAVIVVGHADHVLNMVEDFKKVVEDYNKYNEHKISAATGYSTRKYRHSDPDFYNRLYREADDAMYANKVRMHEELGEEVRNIKKD